MKTFILDKKSNVPVCAIGQATSSNANEIAPETPPATRGQISNDDAPKTPSPIQGQSDIDSSHSDNAKDDNPGGTSADPKPKKKKAKRKTKKSKFADQSYRTPSDHGPLEDHNFLTHNPKHPDCPICQQAKMTKAYRKKSKPWDERLEADKMPLAEKYGDSITLDHFVTVQEGHESVMVTK